MNRFEESCDRIEAMLPAFAERDLAAEDAATVSAHLDSCARCREALAALASLEATLVARRSEVPPVEPYLRGVVTMRAPVKKQRSLGVRTLRALTSVPGIAIVLVMWAAFLVSRYDSRLSGDGVNTQLERLIAFLQRGVDLMVAAGGGDVWTLTAVYGALAIGVIVSAGALTLRLVRR